MTYYMSVSLSFIRYILLKIMQLLKHVHCSVITVLILYNTVKRCGINARFTKTIIQNNTIIIGLSVVH